MTRPDPVEMYAPKSVEDLKQRLNYKDPAYIEAVKREAQEIHVATRLKELGVVSKPSVIVECTRKQSPNCLGKMQRTHRSSKASCSYCTNWRRTKWAKENQ